MSTDHEFVTEDGDVWCCEQCYNLASQSTDSGPMAFDPPLTPAESEAYWDAITDDSEPSER